FETRTCQRPISGTRRKSLISNYFGISASESQIKGSIRVTTGDLIVLKRNKPLHGRHPVNGHLRPVLPPKVRRGAQPGGGQPTTAAEDDIPLIEAALRIASRLPEPPPPQSRSDRPQ